MRPVLLTLFSYSQLTFRVDYTDEINLLCTICIISGIFCFCFGAFSLTKNNIIISSGLAGSCFFGRLSLAVAYYLSLEEVNLALISVAFSFVGAFLYQVPNKYKPFVIGAGIGAGLVPLLALTFIDPVLGLASCVLLSLSMGFLLQLYPKFVESAAFWNGSSIMVLGFNTAVLSVLFLKNFHDDEFDMNINAIIFEVLTFVLSVFITAMRVHLAKLSTVSPRNVSSAPAS